MNLENPLYPPLNDVNSTSYRYDMLNAINEFKQECKILKNKINKLQKLNKKLKIVGYTFVGLSSVTAAVFSSGLILPLGIVAMSVGSITTTSMIVAGSLSALSAIDLLVTKIISSAILANKIRKYNKDYTLYQNAIDETKYFIRKAEKDKVITFEEYSEFSLVIKKTKNIINYKFDIDEDSTQLLQDIKKDIERTYGKRVIKDLKSEIKNEYKLQLKDEIKDSLHSKRSDTVYVKQPTVPPEDAL